MYRARSGPGDRLGSAALVVAIHAALGWALVSSFGVRIAPRAEEALKLFTLSDEPPPPPPIVPPPPEPAPVKTDKPRDAEGAAAPPALRDTPTEVAAPKAKLPLPPPLPAAPVAGQGSAPAAGAAPVPGPGTGRGGTSTGLGSGLSGSGTGGGGAGSLASPPRMIAGSIGDSDYPPAALVVRAQGTTRFAFTVRADGSIADCRITRSSSNRALDEATCRLALRRFRFRPALDPAGRPVAAVENGEQEWQLGPEQELPAEGER